MKIQLHREVVEGTGLKDTVTDQQIESNSQILQVFKWFWLWFAFLGMHILEGLNNIHLVGLQNSKAEPRVSQDLGAVNEVGTRGRR